MKMFQITLFTTLLAMSPLAIAQTTPRFDRQTAALDKVFGKCAANETCLLVTLRYDMTFDSREANGWTYGGLNPWPLASMIKVPNAPWLGLVPNVPNLAKELHTLFPRRGGYTNLVNGINLDSIVNGVANLYDAPQVLRATLRVQKSIYKDDQKMELGKISLPQMPKDHLLIERSAYDKSFNIGIIVPLQFRPDVSINTKMRDDVTLRHVMIVGIPNERGVTEEERGNPYYPVDVPLATSTPIYRLEFVDLSGAGATVMSSLDTVDQ